MISRPSQARLSAAGVVLLFSLVTGAVSENASAQCATQWLPGSGIPGTDGIVWSASMWDRDGAGPMPPSLVVGGEFTIAGTVLANRIAAYDPLSGAWSALGSGMNGYVRADSAFVLPEKHRTLLERGSSRERADQVST